MSNQDEQNNNKLPQSTTDSENTVEETTSTVKTLLYGIGGLILILSIFTLLPMFFTYLSEGDSRAPSEIHPTDSARMGGQKAYNIVKPEK